MNTAYNYYPSSSKSYPDIFTNDNTLELCNRVYNAIFRENTLETSNRVYNAIFS